MGAAATVANPDVLIIAREDDEVAVRLQHALAARGKSVSSLDGPAAARRFTISSRSNSVAVTPAVPLFIRPSAWWTQPPDGTDEAFLRHEEYATLWAAAALSAAPVINRPTATGTVGRLTWGSIAALLDLREPGTEEIHSSGPEVLRDSDECLWGEDATYVSAPISALRPGVPLRARRLNPAALYEIITIVGARAFPATKDPRSAELNLAGHSLKLAAKLGIHFATVTWALDDNTATPVRVNASPDDSDIRYAWQEVAEALCEDLAG
jgi:hypothetical protein